MIKLNEKIKYLNMWSCMELFVDLIFLLDVYDLVFFICFVL